MSTYFNVLGHGSMIFDHIRNRAYEKAILSKITEDSVVLDLGSGLGLHGLIAAKAGAKKVYLIDPSPAVRVAEKVAKDNGLDNVECIQGMIQDVEIEKVDLIISVFTGNFLLTEDLLPSLFYARDHFLKDKGTLIPSRGRMMVMPVQSDEDYKVHIGRWRDEPTDSIFNQFGLSYQELTKYSANALQYDDFTKKKWIALANSEQLCDIDFYSAEKAECFEEVNIKATNTGLLHGWLGWFDMCLEGDWLTTSPSADSLHWRQVLIPSARAEKVTEGDALFLDLKRPEYGDWSWSSTNLGSDDSLIKPENLKKQSTFLSEPLNIGDIQKKSPGYKASLSRKGEVLKQLMLLLDGERTNQEIAEQLFKKFPDKFTDLDAVNRYLQNQILLLC